MKKVLVVDDAAIFREPIAAAVRAAGYEVDAEMHGGDALQVIMHMRPDLILLDLAMPGMDGLTCLKCIRDNPDIADIPVIMLTATSDPATMKRAEELGVNKYMLKSSFSLDELLSQVQKCLGAGQRPSVPMVMNEGRQERQPESKQRAAVTVEQASSNQGATSTLDEIPPARGVETPSSKVAAAVVNETPPAKAPAAEVTSRRLTREETLERVNDHVETRTLAGNVAEIVALAGSGRSDATDLAEALKRDPIITARVLQAANSAAYVSNKARIATIEDAVRNVGFGTIRSLAASIGIFETFPIESTDGFNVIHCLQHCLAVAGLMDHLVPATDDTPSELAYVIGLCHDLAEIIVRQLFTEEYGAVLSKVATGDKPKHVIEAEYLGLPRYELISHVLSKLGMPPEIINPICECEKRFFDKSLRLSKMACLLRLADYYAHGLLLAPSKDAPVGPVTITECRNTLGNPNPKPMDTAGFRNGILSLTTYLARLPSGESAKLYEPPFPKSKVKIWYGRHKAFSTLDPLGTALELIACPEIHKQVPNHADELSGYGGMVIAVPTMKGDAFSIQQAERVTAGTSLPTLYLIGKEKDVPSSAPANIVVAKPPISLAKLADFIARC
ncbi:MAG: HDOD domain-containing protein [Phycisphaerales bacterium]|nr:HDOD domain-containing protein [Phycisphaerales bacterium]